MSGELRNFRKWRTAESAAKAVGGEVLAMIRDAGDAPLAAFGDELALAGELHDNAHELFDAAIAEIEERVRALHPEAAARLCR